MIKRILIEKPQSFVELNGKPIEQDLTVATDTRKVTNENAFICLYGECYDAHSMLDKIVGFETIKYIVVEKKRTFPEILEQLLEVSGCTFIVVNDVFVYIRELALHCSRDWKKSGNKTMIGLTGSAGKTSSKETIFQILNYIFPGKVMATQGNLNNHIGVPLTLFRLSPEYDIAIVEMGTNAPGEIEELAKIVEPESGLITNVGAAHLEKLKSLEGVSQEKSSLYHVVNSVTEGTGVFVLPSDDIYLNRLKDFPGVVTFGINGNYKLFFESGRMRLQKSNAEWEFDNDIMEKHLMKNIAQAFILCRTLFPEYDEQIFEAAKKVKLDQKNRGELIKIGDQKIYLDAYNANPTSMNAAIDTLETILEKDGIGKNKTALILGDMKELGSESVRFHEELGEYVLQKKFEHVYFIGEFGKAFSRTFEKARLFASTAELATNKAELSGYDFLFLKGSRSMALEKIVEHLRPA